MIKNKYGCQMHSTYAYYCWVQSLLGYFFYLHMQSCDVYVDYSTSAVGHI